MTFLTQEYAQEDSLMVRISADGALSIIEIVKLKNNPNDYEVLAVATLADYRAKRIAKALTGAHSPE